MHALTAIVIYTANILGVFYDPFEFAGDYGPEVNPIREKVFELVVSKEALAKNLSDDQILALIHHENAVNPTIDDYRTTLIADAIEADKAHGPTLSELFTGDLVKELAEIQQQLGSPAFTPADLNGMISFLDHYGDRRIFHFFRNNPNDLLSLDKILRDKASIEGKPFDLPILSSTQPLGGNDAHTLKLNLLHRLFSEEVLQAAKPEAILRASLIRLDQHHLESFFGSGASNSDLELFCTPAGQVFFYWLYQSLNLQLISEEAGMIDQVNRVKDIFAKTLGDPQVRANSFKENLVAANAGVVFTQESDAIVPRALMEGDLFLPVDKQNPLDGTFVFLRRDLWENDYRVVPLENYDGYAKGRLNLILATNALTGGKFLLASAHGHSTRAEDGRLQISLIMQKFEQLRGEPGNAQLQLLIGIDANTKTERDVAALREHLENLGLTGTSVGPTTIKQRMVTVQHSKAGRFAVDEEDYLITLKTETGGAYTLAHPTVGFSGEKPDGGTPLPNLSTSSDHYPVGATLTP